MQGFFSMAEACAEVRFGCRHVHHCAKHQVELRMMNKTLHAQNTGISCCHGLVSGSIGLLVKNRQPHTWNYTHVCSASAKILVLNVDENCE
jgi:hypothetical protein